MAIDLYDYQLAAVSQLKTGSILCGGVGSGKSIVALKYYQEKEDSKDLYIITTAAKRNSGEWLEDASMMGIVPKVVDSWNNIRKYVKVQNAFFIFDEQRVIGYGAWVRSFLKITKVNAWILLSATPGDNWMDYIPVFIANGFYRNKTEFVQDHIIWSSYTKFPKVERYTGTAKLQRFRMSILVNMDYKNKTTQQWEDMILFYDKEKYDLATRYRKNPFNNKPIRDIAELGYLTRMVVNSDPSRLARVSTLISKHHKVIIFYNFNYELDILRSIADYPNIKVAEYNGHKHEAIPDGERWAYLVQYIAGAEGWNCIETNTVIFYSLNYSWRMMQQAGGRIDRLNTPFSNLYYYRLMSDSPIDKAILKALKEKKDFNESRFFKKSVA